MENKDCLPDGIPADRRSGLRNAGPKQEFFNARSSVDVNRPRDVAPIILIIKSTVNDVEIRYLRFVDPIKQIVQLNTQMVLVRKERRSKRYLAYRMASNPHQTVLRNATAG